MRAIILSVMHIAVAFGLFGNECREFVPCEKTYVKAEQIGFSEDQIWVNLEGWVIQTSAIHSDTAGYYFLNYNPDPCKKPDWKCDICGTCNAHWSWTCKMCGRLKGGSSR